MLTFLGLRGSLRRASINAAPLRAAAQLALPQATLTVFRRAGP